MLRKVWDVAAKDLLLLTKDRIALVWMLALPLLLMGILGSVFSGFGSNSGTVTATLPVIDQDGGAGARSLIEALRSVSVLKIQMQADVSAQEKAVRNGDQVALLIIPAGFSHALATPGATARVTYYAVSGNSDTRVTIAADTVRAVVQQLAWRQVIGAAVARAQLQSTGRVDPAVAGQITAQAARQLATHPPVAVQAINATGRVVNAADQTVPGYTLMFALFGVTAGAATILDEKEAGTFKRLLIAPLPPFALLGGKLLAQFIQSLAQTTLLFVIGAVLFKIDLGSSPPALALLIIGVSFAATGLGLLLVSIVKTQRQLRPVTTLVVLCFSALGGSWFPLWLEPQWMQGLSKVTINSYAMQAFNGLMIFGKTFLDVLPSIIALFIYGVVCFAIARRTFRFREA